jgi:hypothetical protein
MGVPFLLEPMSWLVYLDESGDLGWNFGAPYRGGGSSRFLTIGALCVTPAQKHFPKRIVKDLYVKFGWDLAREKKWPDMTTPKRREFAELAGKLCAKRPDIELHCITVQKQNVMQHIRNDSNKLYNYMIGLMLTGPMAAHADVTMVPDPRSIKVQSGNSLRDYLRIDLWFVKNSKTLLKTQPEDSQFCRGIQFTDMLCGLMRAHYEDGEATNYGIRASRIRQRCLYFR